MSKKVEEALKVLANKSIEVKIIKVEESVYIRSLTLDRMILADKLKDIYPNDKLAVAVGISICTAQGEFVYTADTIEQALKLDVQFLLTCIDKMADLDTINQKINSVENF